MIALLALAVAAVIGAEWPRLGARYGREARAGRERARRKASLKLVRTETEEFEASVQRDLASPARGRDYQDSRQCKNDPSHHSSSRPASQPELVDEIVQGSGGIDQAF